MDSKKDEANAVAIPVKSDDAPSSPTKKKDSDGAASKDAEEDDGLVRFVVLQYVLRRTVVALVAFSVCPAHPPAPPLTYPRSRTRIAC